MVGIIIIFLLFLHCAVLLHQNGLHLLLQFVTKRNLLINQLRLRGCLANTSTLEQIHTLHGSLILAHFHARSDETDVTNLALPAHVRAAGPVHAHLIRTLGKAELLVETLRELERVALRVNLRLRTPACTRAADETGDEHTWERRELLHDRLLQERIHLLLGNVWDDDVLVHRQAHLAAAKFVRNVCKCRHVTRLERTRGHAETRPLQAVLLLIVDAKHATARAVVMRLVYGIYGMVRNCVGKQRRRLGRTREIAAWHATSHLVAEVVESHLVDAPHQSRLGSRATHAVVAERRENGVAQCRGVSLGNERVERDGVRAPRAGEESTHLDVESELSVVVRLRGHERDVVDVRVFEHVGGSHDADVEFARQVGNGWIAVVSLRDVLRQRLAHRTRVVHLLRIDARDG
mmetsp:Transcript_12069/g.27361  ORF Transcript_12069/g.27361 Transcript_12069/m.27361 type:complete len:405 (+) Transcript_12069:67-1281(+)